MAAGATVSGQVRIVRETAFGDRVTVAGPFSSLEADQTNLENRIFLNAVPGRDTPPAGANMKQAPGAVFRSGEKILIQHLSAVLEEAIQYDADEFEISAMRKDLQTGQVQDRTYTVADTTLTADATTSKTVWTTVWSYTVPDQERVKLKGQFKAAAIETA